MRILLIALGSIVILALLVVAAGVAAAAGKERPKPPQ